MKRALTNQTIAFVTPRYGVEIVGGAERLVRSLAEQLVGAGQSVEVLTTCTERIGDIKNTLPPGISELNGVTVRRFLADYTDIARFHRVAGLAQSGAPVSMHDQLEFVRHGVNSGPLYEHLRSHQERYRCVIFAPYLVGTTYWGVQAVAEKALLLPCLHDEPFAYFDIFRDMLEQAQGIIFNAEPERQFAYNRLGLVNSRSAVVGMGFDPDTAPGDGPAFRSRHSLGLPLLLYTGRIEGGKNVPLLAEYFARYADERRAAGDNGDHTGGVSGTLALGGRGELSLPERPEIVRLGFLDEESLPDAYAAASAFCQPSVNESFSIVIMESWLQGRPVLVHGDSAVTSDHVARSGGGLIFRDYPSFRDALRQLFGDPSAAAAMGARGRAYVQREYSHQAVLARLVEAIERFTAPRSRYEVLSQRALVHARSFSQGRWDERMSQLLAEIQAEGSVGLDSGQSAALRQAAQVGMPGYVVQSSVPLVGPLLGWLRRNLTSHLREPYLDPIINRQEQFNRQLLDVLLPALERSTRAQQRLERQVRLLERQLSALEKHEP